MRIKPIIVAASIFGSGVLSSLGHEELKAYNTPERAAERQRLREMDRKVDLISPDTAHHSIIYHLDSGDVQCKYYLAERVELWSNGVGFLARGRKARLHGA